MATIRSFIFALHTSAFALSVTRLVAAFLHTIDRFVLEPLAGLVDATTSLTLDRIRHELTAVLVTLSAPFIAFAERMRTHARYTAGYFSEGRSIA